MDATRQLFAEREASVSLLRNESFAATQDGLFYLLDGNFRQIGKNAEIDSMVGKFGDDIACLAGNEIAIGNGEGAYFYNCDAYITAVSFSEQQLLIGTTSGLLKLDGGKLRPTRTRN